MRQLRNGVFRLSTALATACIVVGGLVSSAAAMVEPTNVPAPKKMAAALQALAAGTNPSDTLDVIVQGPGARGAAAAAGHVTRDLSLVGGVAARVPVAALNRLAHDPNVTFVSPNAPIAFAAGDISAGNLATHYPGRDSAGNPWSAGAYGAGVGIAVIDSGVTPSADFGSRLVQVSLDGQGGENLDDTVGHGTMVAGVAAGHSADGRFIGIAPRANIYAININRPAGVYTSDVITALKWVFDNAHAYNIRVVNLSLTETVKSSYRESALDLAVERLWASGVFVVVAAGNLGAGQIDYAPANDPLVLTMGAFDTMGTSGPGDDTLAPWSSGGTTIDSFAKPELVAPGRRIAAPLAPASSFESRAPAANRVAAGYATISGSSFAAPQAAGAAAIILEWHPTWSPDNVKWALIAKQAAKPRNSKVGSLSLSSSYNYSGTPGRANQGVAALVCAPGSICLNSGTVASKWDSSSWNSSSWNSSSWNSSSWNSSSWNSTANWDSSSWNSSSWNSSSWNGTTWNYGSTLFDPWG
jgi:serine protease AprX